MSWLRRATSAVLFGICCPLSTVVAQSRTTVIIAGVADAETGAPLTDALVRLPDLGRATRTDWIGEARLAGVTPGDVRIQVLKLGYAPADITLPVKGDSVGPVFRLSPSTSVLDTVRVTSRTVPARMIQFETRRRVGIGRFLTDSVLEKEAGRSLAQVLSMRFPGIRAVALPYNPTHYQLVSAHFSTSNSHGAKNCGVDIYVDGMLYVDDIDAIFPEDVAGVEFYTTATIPPRYRRGTGSCEVVLIWSKY